MDYFISILKALAHETRFRIINLLLTHDLCVGALANYLGISKAAVSQHLQILRKAGLVRGEKRGYWTHYSVDKSAIYQIAEDLIKRINQAPDFRVACHRSLPNKNNTNDMERRGLAMCKDCCQQPDRLKGKPEECTPEQIRECHGDEKDHPCVPKGKKVKDLPVDAISVQALTKRFGEVQAVAGVSFAVRKGELFGFLGPNGAGKTTTINMLTGLARQDTGKIQIAGIDCTGNPKAAQHLSGVVPDESNLYPELTGFDNLCFCAALYGMRKNVRETRARELLDTFGLADAGNRKFAGYSRGMKRRLTIAAGIIHNPSILFLDEPTTGIDVASARQIRQLIAGLHRAGTTIFLTTHYIEEAERLCGRIAFIVQGKIVRIDTVANLIQPIQEKHVLQLAVSNSEPALHDKLAAAFPYLAFRGLDQGLIRVEAHEPVHVGLLVRFLENLGAEVMEARRMQPSLEDIFVQITGIEADAMRKEKEKKGGGI